MGFLGLFGNKSGTGALKKHAARVANKRAQAPDRWESIKALGAIESSEACEALLVRFTYQVDPSITDQEEKDAAFEAVVRQGERAIEPLRAFLRRSESIAWPLKGLDRVLSEGEVIAELIAILEPMDTEYERDPQKKIEVLSALEERRDPRIADAVVRFLEDVNETARFHAVSTLLAQENVLAHRQALLDTLIREDSVRVRARVLQGFAETEMDLGPSVEKVRAKLPPGFSVDPRGRVRRA